MELWVLPITDRSRLIADGTRSVVVASEHVLANQPETICEFPKIGGPNIVL